MWWEVIIVFEVCLLYVSCYIACTHHTVMATCGNMFTSFVFVDVWAWRGRVTFTLTDAPCLFYAATVLLPRLDFVMGLFIFFFLPTVIKHLMFKIGNYAHRQITTKAKYSETFFFPPLPPFSIVSECLLQLLNMLQGQIRSCVGCKRYIFLKETSTCYSTGNCTLPIASGILI